jgi:hypothetical protein
VHQTQTLEDGKVSFTPENYPRLEESLLGTRRAFRSSKVALKDWPKGFSLTYAYPLKSMVGLVIVRIFQWLSCYTYFSESQIKRNNQTNP